MAAGFGVISLKFGREGLGDEILDAGFVFPLDIVDEVWA